MLIVERLNFAHPGQNEDFSYNLSVAPGEIVAITGRSGVGKSTLLDLIAGFLKPRSGTITFNETDLTLLPPEKRPVSILFQADNLFDHLTVNANLSLGLPTGGKKEQALKRVAANRSRSNALSLCLRVSFIAKPLHTFARHAVERFQNKWTRLFGSKTRPNKDLEPGFGSTKTEKALVIALKTVDLAGFGPRRARNLSGGQQQRVALARTLLRDQPVLLLDEPFANLDRQTAASMRLLVRTLTNEHKWCTLIVSHQPEDARDFADRSFKIVDGKLKLS